MSNRKSKLKQRKRGERKGKVIKRRTRDLTLNLLLDNLEAFAVDNARAGFIVFLLGDPHLLEGGQRGQDGSTDPDGVFTLRGSDDLDLNGGWGQGGDFLLHTIGNTGVHGGSTGEDGVGVQVLTDINVALHDRVVDGLVDTARFHTQEGWLEQGFGATESLVTNGDDLSVGQFVGFLEGGGGGGGGHFLLEVQSDIAKFLLDVTNDFSLSGGGERVTATSQVQTEDGVGKGVTFIDGDGVGDTITRVQDDTGGTTGSVQGQDSLDGDVHGRAVEGLEHDLGHLFTVGLGVEGSLSEKDGVFLGGNTQFIVEGVMPA